MCIRDRFDDVVEIEEIGAKFGLIVEFAGDFVGEFFKALFFDAERADGQDAVKGGKLSLIHISEPTRPY